MNNPIISIILKKAGISMIVTYIKNRTLIFGDKLHKKFKKKKTLNQRDLTATSVEEEIKDKTSLSINFCNIFIFSKSTEKVKRNNKKDFNY